MTEDKVQPGAAVSPAAVTDEQIAAIREKLRETMLYQMRISSDDRWTYLDGFAQGISYSIGEIDKVFAPALAAAAIPDAPQGMVLVPRKPTTAMLNAAIDVDAFKLGDISPLGFRISPQQLFERCYEAMLAAALSNTGGAAIPAEPVADVKPQSFTIEERDDDMLICATDWLLGRRCIARRPKALSNAVWRPTAQSIVEILNAFHATQPLATPQDSAALREAAVSLYRSFVSGVASRDVWDKRMTKIEADDWVAHTVRAFAADLAALSPEGTL